jgi:negative regulator of flagellin synthesis FlgM
MVDRINPTPGNERINRSADSSSPTQGVGPAGGPGAAAGARPEAVGREETATWVTADSVSISSEAAFRARALDAVQAAPDVRADRVEALREAIASGNYNVTSADLAARLLGRVDNG